MSLHEKINKESRGCFDVKMHRNTWQALYEEHESAQARIEELEQANKIMREALESIAAFHLVGNPICEPEDAIHIVVNDTEIAREAVIQIRTKLEGVSK